MDVLEAYGRFAVLSKAWLVFVGDGELRSELEHYATTNNLTRVRFLGFRNQTEISKAYLAADIFVLSSHFETWGLVVNEAMAAGLPVIASDRVGCRIDLVQHDQTGLVFPAGSVEGLCDAMDYLASNPEERHRMAGQARATVQIEPMPICLGQAIDGTLTIETNGPVRVQEVRLELRVKVQATVHGGEQEELTVWVGRLAADGQFGGPSQSLPFRADIPPVWLPTIELPHGSAQAEFHVILAKARARDTHLVRDVAICTTTEV